MVNLIQSSPTSEASTSHAPNLGVESLVSDTSSEIAQGFRTLLQHSKDEQISPHSMKKLAAAVHDASDLTIETTPEMTKTQLSALSGDELMQFLMAQSKLDDATDDSPVPEQLADWLAANLLDNTESDSDGEFDNTLLEEGDDLDGFMLDSMVTHQLDDFDNALANKLNFESDEALDADAELAANAELELELEQQSEQELQPELEALLTDVTEIPVSSIQVENVVDDEASQVDDDNSASVQSPQAVTGEVNSALSSLEESDSLTSASTETLESVVATNTQTNGSISLDPSQQSDSDNLLSIDEGGEEATKIVNGLTPTQAITENSKVFVTPSTEASSEQVLKSLSPSPAVTDKSETGELKPISQLVVTDSENEALDSLKVQVSDDLNVKTTGQNPEAKHVELLASMATANREADVTSTPLQGPATIVEAPKVERAVLEAVNPLNVAQKLVKLPEVIPALSDRIHTMIKNDIQHGFIRLDPPELGALEVRIQVTQESTHIQIVSQSQQVREALESQSVRLRESLAEQGLNLASLDVSEHSTGGSSAQSEGGQAGGEVVEDGDHESQNIDTESMMSVANGLVDHYV